MSECYMGTTLIERCSSKKQVIDMVCPYNAVHFIMSGCGYFNGRKLSAGMGFTVLNHEHVRYHPDPDDPWTYLFIIFHGKDKEKFFKEQDLGYMVESPYVFNFTNAKELMELYCVYKGTIEPLCKTRHVLSAMFRLFLAFNRPSDIKTDFTATNIYLKSATEYIDINYTGGISVSSVASILGISRSYLRNIFYEAYGISPQQYIMSMRIDHAKELLSQTPLSISAVAEACGYLDVLQFSKIFKKHTGESPRNFRKNFKISHPGFRDMSV